MVEVGGGGGRWVDVRVGGWVGGGWGEWVGRLVGGGCVMVVVGSGEGAGWVGGGGGINDANHSTQKRKEKK